MNENAVVKAETPMARWRSAIVRSGIALNSLFFSFVFYPQIAMAADGTMWDKASEVMKDVYNKILGISTVAAVVTASVALLMMNFSKNGRTVEESRAWLKRIVITWIILNSLGYVVAYISPYFQGGQWTGN